jgi:preprotein translocase subunit SecD
MIQLRPWKIVLVLAALIFGLLFTLPNVVPVGSLPGFLPNARLNLGLDLQGGSYLLYEIDTQALQKEQLNNMVEEVRGALQASQTLFTGLGQVNGAITVRITDPTKIDAAYQALTKLATPIPNTAAQDFLFARGPDQTIQITQSPQAAQYAASRAVQQTIEIIRRRIDALGTREPSITQQGSDRIVIEAAGLSDPEKLKAVIGKTAKLTFQMVDDSVAPADVAAGRVPPEDMVVQSDDKIAPSYVLQRRSVVTGEMLTTAQQTFDPQSGSPDVFFRFNGQGARRFGDATTQNIGKRFAIVLDNRVISAPVIQGAINGGSGSITGNFTEESAGQLALLLRSGALPAPLNVIEQRTVGAELGADAVRSGAIALAIGALSIVVFIVLAYGLFGLFATAALMLNVLMIVALMSLTQATLTLPGIAGLILTLAVAVDANVLIYERMRDEGRSGRSLILSIDAGYRLAWPSIMDANVTTLISAAIMFQFGSGPVKGFAWTLSIGVLTSVFTAIIVTQVLIGWWFKLAKPKQLPI